MASQLASGDLVSDRYASALYDLAAEKKLVFEENKKVKSLLTKGGSGVSQKKLNELGYPVNDPYGLIAAFYRAFGGKQNVR